VRQIADVYVNGVHLGTNKTGFIPFGYDITEHVTFGSGENTIAVRVNNDRDDDFQNNTLPWNHEHWHPVHGGIYRNVFLHAVDKLHVTLPLYDNLKTVGTYVYASNVSASSADVTTEAEVQNDYARQLTVSYEAKIVDNDGKVMETITDSASLQPGAKHTFSGTATLTNPNLWFTRHPYLYTVHTIIRNGNEVTDVYETPLGIRDFRFDKDSGFWLNGEHVKLHGWGQKPTNAWPGIGAALPDWLRDFTYKLMDEAGGNFIRWGHSAGAPAEIAMGDKYGFVTLMPGVCGESDNTGEAWDIRINAFRDTVVYYRNHPSIFIWEGGNWAISKEHFQQVTDIINTYDPNGKRLLGNRRAEVKAHADKFVTIEVGTEGWERKFPQLPIVESEYFRDESPRRVWDNDSLPSYGDYPRKHMNQYKWTSEEFAVLQADHWWNKMGKKAYHSGGANWIFSDGPHGGRNPSEVVRASGEVDAVRLQKEGFYALKSMWRPEPQVHIVGHWTYENQVKKDIYVISNCSPVKLYVNGELIGTDNTPDNGYVYKFSNVAFKPGTIRAEGFIDDSLSVSQEKQTVGPKSHIKLTPITGPDGWRADGSDIVLLDFEVVDRDGNRVPTNQQDITFTISGAGEWRGGYNSNTPENSRALTLYTEAGINRVAIRSTLAAGTVVLTAKGEGVQTARVEISSEPVEITNGLTRELPQVYNDPLGAPEPQPVPLPEIPESNALSAKVIAFSSEQSKHPASKIVDGDRATRWGAEKPGFPHMVELDLGGIYSIDKANLVAYQSRLFKYTIEVKTTSDGDYALALDQTSGDVSNTNSFPAVPARYVKLTFIGGFKANWVSLREIELFAQKGSQAQVSAPANALFANFSYTGDGKAALRQNLKTGDKVYTDRPFTYGELPAYLIGADYILTPNQDKTYWARDQLQFLSGKDMEVYVAHDDRYSPPEFITSDYTDTGDDIVINQTRHSLYKRVVAKDTGVIMAGNFDNNPSANSNMYVVFARAVPNASK